MRIIAGRLRGRRLLAPPGLSTRPTTDRVREALFSILGDLEGDRVAVVPRDHRHGLRGGARCEPASADVAERCLAPGPLVRGRQLRSTTR